MTNANELTARISELADLIEAKEKNMKKISVISGSVKVWTGTSVFFAGLNLARVLRKNRGASVMVTDFPGVTAPVRDFMELCYCAGEMASIRRSRKIGYRFRTNNHTTDIGG